MLDRECRPRLLSAPTDEGLTQAAENAFGMPVEELRKIMVESRDISKVQAIFCPAIEWKKYENMDAAYGLYYQADGVFLEVLPPQGFGRQLNVEALIDYVKRKGLSGLAENTLRELVNVGYGRARVAPAQHEKILNEEARVLISSDEMSAGILLLPPEEGGRQVTMEDLQAVLKGRHVSFGVQEEKLKQLLEERPYGKCVEIACGQPVKNGEDGTLTFHFDREHNGAPRTDEVTGKVDFWQLDLFEQVHADDLLVSRTLATAGEAGMTVTGKVLTPRFGKDYQMPRGKNVRYNEDKTAMFANVTGRVEFVKDSVVVSNIYEIKGDVSLAVGNVDFDGTVIIRGSVLSKMSVRASGDVTIYGGVQDARVEAGGNVTIMSGLQGRGDGVVISGGTLTARFIEQARVRAQVAVRTDEIVYSEVNCSGDVVVTGKIGSIVGGTVRAYHMVVAQVIGAVSHPKTRIDVGVNPQAIKRNATLNAQIKEYRQKLEELQKVCNYLMAKGGAAGENRERFRQALATKVTYAQNLQSMEEEYERVESEITQADNGIIHVLDTAHPGASLAIANVSYMVSGSPIRSATFKITNDQLQFYPCMYEEERRQKKSLKK
jgi:Predicted polymerase, most proteins contain PALM domain, HD hydrolase domain and Zn-ribbon domain